MKMDPSHPSTLRPNLSRQATFVYKERELLLKLEDCLLTAKDFNLLHLGEIEPGLYTLIEEIYEVLDDLEQLREE